MTKRRVTPYDDQIPPDLWVQVPRADLHLRLIEAVLTIARLRGATSLDVQEALSVKWDRPSDDFGLRRTLGTLSEYDLAYITVQPIVLHQKIGLFRWKVAGGRTRITGTSGGRCCGHRALPRSWRARRQYGSGWCKVVEQQVCQAWRLIWKRCACARGRGGWKRGTRRSDRSRRGSICRA